MRRGARLLAGFLLVGCPGIAGAHTPIAGIGHFYGGMLHPAMVPAHAMAIIAMGLWLGQRWPAHFSTLVGFLVAVPIGMAAPGITRWLYVELAILGATAVVAVVVAAARDAPAALRMVVAIALGGLLGLDSRPDGLSGRPLWLSLAGTWLAVLLGLSWVIALSEVAGRAWMRIGLRVIASWLCAAAVLTLALSAFGPRTAPTSTPATATGSR